jgi:PAS domain S-box-containing protein
MNTPWFMVAKVDEDEIHAPVRRQAWTTGLLSVLLMLLASLGVALLWRQQRLVSAQQAAAVLRESENRLRKALDVQNVGVMFWDVTSGTLIDANDTFLKIMGYSRQEVDAHQLTWQTFTPPEYIETSIAEMESFRANGRVGPYEKEYLRKDGSRQWFVFAGSALDENRCVEYCIDVSGQKRAESALAESEERLRLALQATNLGLYDLNVQSGEALVNAEYAAMLGYAPKPLSKPMQPGSSAFIRTTGRSRHAPTRTTWREELRSIGWNSVRKRATGTGSGFFRSARSSHSTMPESPSGCSAPIPTSPSASGPRPPWRNTRGNWNVDARHC